MHLLGSVDEQEKECKRAGGDSRELSRKFRRAVDQLIEIRSVRLSPAARTAASPESVNNLKRFVTFDALDYAAKCGSKIPNVFVQRKIFGTYIILRPRDRCGFSHRG